MNAALARERGLRRLSLERAAATYDEAAVLQREVGSRLLERLDVLNLDLGLVCDLGCGTGAVTGELLKKCAGAAVVCLELSPSMLARARRRGSFLRRPRGVCADVDRLPLRDSCVDLLFCNLLFHRCPDIDGVLLEMGRVAKPGGALLFATYGPDTLRELRACWGASDAPADAARLVDLHDVGDALIRAGFVEPVLDVEHLTVEYREVSRLVADLRALGERNLSPERRKTLTGKGALTALAQGYERFRSQGLLPATFEIVYGTAWASADGGTFRPSTDGVARLPLDSVRRRLRGRS